MISYWRLLTGESNTSVYADTDVDTFMQAGMEALNRRIEYRVLDATVTLVAGTREYDLPTDFYRPVWVEWAGNPGEFLAKTDLDELRDKRINWRNEPPGAPEDYFIYGDQIVVRKTPSGDAVTKSNVLTVRYVAAPADFNASGPDGLLSNDHRLPVYYAVVEYASAHPDSALAKHRIEMFTARFETESKLLAETYAARRLMR